MKWKLPDGVTSHLTSVVSTGRLASRSVIDNAVYKQLSPSQLVVKPSFLRGGLLLVARQKADGWRFSDIPTPAL
jgi:hypothetical protein